VIFSVRTVRIRGGSPDAGHLMLSDSEGKRSLNCAVGKRSSNVSLLVAFALAAIVPAGGAWPHWTSREDSGMRTARRAIARQRDDAPNGVAHTARVCVVDFGSTPTIHPPKNHQTAS
jgi:hypothetical protein